MEYIELAEDIFNKKGGYGEIEFSIMILFDSLSNECFVDLDLCIRELIRNRIVDIIDSQLDEEIK